MSDGGTQQTPENVGSAADSDRHKELSITSWSVHHSTSVLIR